MKNHWHEQIQRYVNGQSGVEEAAALQAALNDDAELRALYLDYMNLDVALGAAAELAAITENGAASRIATFPRHPVRVSPRYWRWVAAAAACAALVMWVALARHRDSSRERPDLAATVSATQSAITRLSFEPPPPLPAWMSPTASMLDQPRISP